MTGPSTLEQLQELRGWLQRTETVHDTAALVPVRGLAATLDTDTSAWRHGDPLPPLWHWLYFQPQALQSQLSGDGHPRRGGFLPPVPLPRRMWAGGRLHWEVDNPMRLGDALTRTSRIAAIEHKTGLSGEMVFVQIEHTVSNDRGRALVEVQDLVYRHEARPGAGTSEETLAEEGAPWQRVWLPDPVMLFRYSALTFNGHRIHYDRDHAMQVEGYPGLVVHGPLIATLLLDLVRQEAPRRALARFEFRALRPSFDSRPLRVNGAPAPDASAVRLWAQDGNGLLTLTARADFA